MLDTGYWVLDAGDLMMVISCLLVVNASLLVAFDVS